MEKLKGKFFIIDVKLNYRGHWATATDGEVYEVRPNGVLVLELLILNGLTGETHWANVDILYGLKEEAEGLYEDKWLRGRVVRKYVRDELLSREVQALYWGGHSWRLNPEDTQAIRREIFGVCEVPVSYKYLNRLRDQGAKKYDELKHNPRFRIREWKVKLISYAKS